LLVDLRYSVLVDEAAEYGFSFDPPVGQINDGCRQRWICVWRPLIAGLVGTVSVVVDGVLGENPAEMACSEDQDPVQEFAV
jgi:hypothetical protein